jgi:hypothetical protein
MAGRRACQAQDRSNVGETDEERAAAANGSQAGDAATFGYADAKDSRASDRASASGSGANIDNATRQRLVALKNKGTFGWSSDEKSALQNVIDGTGTGNAARTAGNMLGGHGTVGTMGEIAAGGLIEAAMSGGVGPMTAVAGMAPAVAGYTAKKLSDALTKSRVDNLRAVIGASGDASKLPLSLNPQPVVSASANAIARALAAKAVSP